VAIRDDVLVIGGGLAGMTAALAAADGPGSTDGDAKVDDSADRDVSVRLVTKSESTLQQASGLIDVLGYPRPHERDGDRGPVVDPFDAIDSLPDEHPYRRVGVDALRGGLAVFDAAVGDQYRGAHTDRNALVPTVGGTVKPTARYPESVATGLASDDGTMGIVGFAGDTAVDADRIASHLAAAGVPFSVVAATISIPGDLDGTDQRSRLAHALDRDEAGVRTQLADRARRAIADAVDAEATGDATDEAGETSSEDEAVSVDRVGFPAVLGRESPAAVRDALADHLGADVFEIPPDPPSLPGRRLRDCLRGALRDAGVAVTTGVPIVDHETTESDDESPPLIETVYADRNGTRVPYEPRAIVLATGGLVGGGIDSTRETVYEPVFDCHVAHPDDRYAWSDERTFGEHAFAQFGVTIDADARVLADDTGDTGETGEGDLAYANLTAAGGVIGSYDPAAEKSASGVSLATGYAAGRTAARLATGGDGASHGPGDGASNCPGDDASDGSGDGAGREDEGASTPGVGSR
jgi:glycerol-3-phosphate dehydrogenase subunit B